MSIKQSTCYVAVCDVCRDEYENGDGDIMHLETPGDAVAEAENGDWIEVGDKHFCERDRPICMCGHTWRDHDYTLDYCEADGADEQKCGCLVFTVPEVEVSGE